MTKKNVYYDERALKELKNCREDVQLEFRALILKLKEDGQLKEPEAKKMAGYKNLYELRVRLGGQFRGLYAYLKTDIIMILSIFQKKTQKTPQKEIDKALKRLKDYE